jgi:hypothetical protein
LENHFQVREQIPPPPHRLGCGLPQYSGRQGRWSSARTRGWWTSSFSQCWLVNFLPDETSADLHLQPPLTAHLRQINYTDREILLETSNSGLRWGWKLHFAAWGCGAWLATELGQTLRPATDFQLSAEGRQFQKQ